tara:strand:+ start:268 stop:588 length:321 start_codon:yes stop_codon:yes gene_type:complete|eukprot:scaffold2718_cov38-Phaeocystis_antarctica.AAC.2
MAAVAEANHLGVQTPAEALAPVLPQIGSPPKKTARIQFDGDSATAGKASDAEHSDRMRSKRGSIGVTKLNESKAKRAAAAHAHQQQACHFSCLKLSPCPLNAAFYL